METSPSAIAFRGIRNVDMIPFIRDVIDTLREFDLRRVGSSKVYKTRMETELQPHLVPHWVQPLQQPPSSPFFHTRIQKWKRHNMMRVLEAAADEIAGDNLKIAEVTDALRRRVEPMGPHLQAAVDSFIQRLRLNRAGAEPARGALLRVRGLFSSVKEELGLQNPPAPTITTEEIKARGQGAKLDALTGPAELKRVDDCLSSSSRSCLGVKRALPEGETGGRDEAKRQCLWDLGSTKTGGQSEGSPALGDPIEATGPAAAPGGICVAPAAPAQCFTFSIPSVDTSAMLAFLQSGLPATSSEAPPQEPEPVAQRKHFDIKQQYALLASLDNVLGPIPKSVARELRQDDDDASDGSASPVVPEFDTSNGGSERAVCSFSDSEEEADLDFEAYQEAVFVATSTRAGDGVERELLEDARLLLKSLIKLAEGMHVGALRVGVVAEKLLPIVERIQERSAEGPPLAEEERYALERLSELLMAAREQVQVAMEDEAEDILVEIDTDKCFQREAARLEKYVHTFLPLVGTALLEEPPLQLRLASVHNRLASALSRHGWVEEAQAEMGCAHALLARLRTASGRAPAPPLSPPPECPISMEKMENPVVLTTGHTFERSAIQRWLNAGNTTCPITRQPLTDLELIPNEALRGYSARWHAENGLPQPQAPIWPDVLQTLAEEDAGEVEKGGCMFQVDDFLSEALKGAVPSKENSSTNNSTFEEAGKGKSGEAYSSDDGLAFCQQGDWQESALDLRAWQGDLEMTEWAVGA